MNAFYKKNNNAGKHNGGYASQKEIIETLVIIKDRKKIELNGEEAMNLYNLIKPVSAPTIK